MKLPTVVFSQSLWKGILLNISGEMNLNDVKCRRFCTWITCNSLSYNLVSSKNHWRYREKHLPFCEDSFICLKSAVTEKWDWQSETQWVIVYLSSTVSFPNWFQLPGVRTPSCSPMLLLQTQTLGAKSVAFPSSLAKS